MRGGVVFGTAAGAVLGLAATPVMAQAQAQALGEAVGFLTNNLVAQGQLAETETISDSSTGKSWVERWTMQYENPRPDVAACSLTFHAEFTRDGQSIFSDDLTYAFGQMTAVRVLSIGRNMDENNARSGHPSWSVVADPPTLDIKITFAGGRTGGFYIRDPGLTPKVAASIARAAELCGATPSREGF
jgi:hypothetical protein